MTVNGNSGMVFRPKTSDRLILHLKDLNLAHSDKWGTNMLVSFLHQVPIYDIYIFSDFCESLPSTFEKSSVHFELIHSLQYGQVCGFISSGADFEIKSAHALIYTLLIMIQNCWLFADL